MRVNSNDSYEQKRDLHVGGLGPGSSGTLTGLIDPFVEPTRDIAGAVFRKVRELADGTDSYVQRNPWQALGIAALAALAVGCLVSRR